MLDFLYCRGLLRGRNMGVDHVPISHTNTSYRTVITSLPLYVRPGPVISYDQTAIAEMIILNVPISISTRKLGVEQSHAW